MRGVIFSIVACVAYLVLKQTVLPAHMSLGEMTLLAVGFLIVYSVIGVPAKKADDLDAQRARNDAFRKDLEDAEGATARDAAIPASAPPGGDAGRKKSTLGDVFRGVLFLRPFTVDRKYVVRNPRKDGFWSAIFFFYKMVLPNDSSLDDAIGYHLRGTTLLAIGDEDAGIGATRYETDDGEWQGDFLALAAGASAIIVVPSLNAGTRWEIEQICSRVELLTKSIFVLTPPRCDNQLGFSALSDVCDLLRQQGLELPDLVESGSALVFSSRRELRLVRKLITVPLLIEHKVDKAALRACLEALEPGSP